MWWVGAGSDDFSHTCVIASWDSLPSFLGPRGQRIVYKSCPSITITSSSLHAACSSLELGGAIFAKPTHCKLCFFFNRLSFLKKNLMCEISLACLWHQEQQEPNMDKTASPLILGRQVTPRAHQLGADLAEKYAICFERWVLLPFS